MIRKGFFDTLPITLNDHSRFLRPRLHARPADPSAPAQSHAAVRPPAEVEVSRGSRRGRLGCEPVTQARGADEGRAPTGGGRHRRLEARPLGQVATRPDREPRGTARH